MARTTRERHYVPAGLRQRAGGMHEDAEHCSVTGLPRVPVMVPSIKVQHVDDVVTEAQSAGKIKGRSHKRDSRSGKMEQLRRKYYVRR